MSYPPANPPQEQEVNQTENRTPMPFKLTPDEAAVLRQCNSDALYRRSIPLSALLMGLVEVNAARASRMGHPRPRGGIIFRHIAAAIAGVILGRVAYMGECQRRILQLPNSPLGDALRKKNPGSWQQQQQMPSSRQDDYPPLERDAAVDVLPKNKRLRDEFQSQDLDSGRGNVHRGLDDNNKPSLDREQKLPNSTDNQTGHISYDDLRRQNRDMHQRTSEGKAFPSPKPSASSRPSSPPVDYVWDKKPADQSGVRRNQWGDLIEE